jgi:hypothetical protein
MIDTVVGSTMAGVPHPLPPLPQGGGESGRESVSRTDDPIQLPIFINRCRKGAKSAFADWTTERTWD